MTQHTKNAVFGVILAVMICAQPQILWAGPPIRGVDLSTVLTFYEVARSVRHKLYASKKAKASKKDKKTLHRIKTIVIDPGHGGENQGAIGVAEIHEKYLTLELAYELRHTLEDTFPGVRVVLTRYWDTELDLNARIHMANTLNADLFLSLHYNSAPHERAVGIETYYLSAAKIQPGVSWLKNKPIASAKPTVSGVALPTDAPIHATFHEEVILLRKDLERLRQHKHSKILARIVQNDLLKHVAGKNRGVKHANFGVLRGALMPAVVVEGGFLSHPHEGKAIPQDRHRASMVKAMTQAVQSFDRVLKDQDRMEKHKSSK